MPISDSRAVTGGTNGRRALTPAACLELLAAGGRGRVAATMRAVPIIIPVTFTLDGTAVLFTVGRTEGWAKAVSDAVVAFETDDLGIDADVAWGVHVIGIARPVVEATGAARFRLDSEMVSGWRIGA